MRQTLYNWIGTLLLLFFSAALIANEGEEWENCCCMPLGDPVRAELVPETKEIKPGQPFWLAIHLTLDDGWHAYWKNPGDAGMPPTIQWNLPTGFTVGELNWPYPERFVDGEIVGFGYENDVMLMAEVIPPAELKEGETLDFNAQVQWVACSHDTCLPGFADLQLSMPVAKQSTLHPTFADRFTAGRRQLPTSDTAVSLEQDGDLIALSLPSDSIPKNSPQPYFCPDVDSHPMDYHTPLKLKSSEDGTLAYLVDVKAEQMQESEDGRSLKGVLVFKNEGDSSKTFAFSVDVPISNAVVSDSGSLVDFENEFEGGIALALLFAFLGGLFLNLMPCVLPVISFKILSFVKLAGKDRSLTFKHGLAFAIGVLVSFWVLAAALLLLQTYGHAVGWGFQLQQPLFVATLAAIILIFGLSLFGLFEFGAFFASWAGSQHPGSNKKEGLSGSFFSGVLATAVATPCTGPFLGSAVGFAVTLPAFWALLIFTSLGVGMASPYLLFAGFPSLLRFLPKPGPWMVTFKELMGFVMVTTVLWLAWVFAAQTGTLALILLMASFLVMTIACWIYGRWGSPIKPRRTRMISYILTAMTLFMGGTMLYQASTLPELSAATESAQSAALAADEWEKFSAERVQELRAQGIPVFIDFTAKWCLICQANHLVLSVNQVAKRMNELGVVKMKADWTKSDPEITKELRKFGRNGVPLYLLYTGADPKQGPTILPQVLTPEIVLQELDKIPAKKK